MVDSGFTSAAFLTRYENFIYLAETGEEIDGFEVFQFAQDDTEFSGVELHGHFEVLHTGANHVTEGLYEPFAIPGVDVTVPADITVVEIEPASFRVTIFVKP